jgi:hypothetical protein
MFTVEKLEGYLTANGFGFKDNGKSVILQNCPSCGNAAWKIWFSQDMPESGDRLLGKCFYCDHGWSTISYLLTMEMDKKEIFDLHEINKIANENEELSLGKLGDLGVVKVEKKEASIFTLDDFVPMADCLQSYHSKYAISRGVPPELYKYIYIDFKGGGIVFPVIEDGKVMGYQKRLLKPADPSRKAHTPFGFEKANYILEYPNVGDIAVCEGPFTAISAYVFGFYGVCTFGAGITGPQLDKIAKIAINTGKKVAIGYDLDKSGLTGLYRAKNVLERKGIEVYRIIPDIPYKAGNDLNDAWKAGKTYRVETIEESLDTSVPLLGNLF